MLFTEEGTIYRTKMENVEYLKKYSLSQQLVLETKTQQHRDKNKKREKKNEARNKKQKKQKAKTKSKKNENILVTDDV